MSDEYSEEPRHGRDNAGYGTRIRLPRFEGNTRDDPLRVVKWERQVRVLIADMRLGPVRAAKKAMAALSPTISSHFRVNENAALVDAAIWCARLTERTQLDCSPVVHCVGLLQQARAQQALGPPLLYRPTNSRPFLSCAAAAVRGLAETVFLTMFVGCAVVVCDEATSDEGATSTPC